ncbi:transposase [Microbacterium sp. A93]|uniref:transposase n=1 Tax=Microbacterium sp. A93 TaxID=3450716 RepID=UPI003F432A62
MIEQLVMKCVPHLLDEFGIGLDTAAEILIVAGDNPERTRSEVALAKLAGINPVPTSSGMTSRKHRFNRSGHRQLNAAIYRTVIVRMQHHEPAKAYVARRTTEGKSKRDIYPLPQTLWHPRGLPAHQGESSNRRNPELTTMGESNPSPRASSAFTGPSA